MFQLARTASLASSLLLVATVSASAQRGSRGTMGLPHIVPAPTATAPAPSSGRGIGGGPQYPTAGVRRSDDLPRLVGAPPRRARSGYATGFGGGAGYGSGYSSGRIVDNGARYANRPHSLWGVGAGCVSGCLHVGGRYGSFYGSYLIGYPFGVTLPVYYYGPTVFAEPVVEQYAEGDAGVYASQPARAASKLIVIGGSGGGGDALTIETVADSVRLNWLGTGRAAREVTLFVADSTQRKLATRSASPAAPTATFEVATLSAPVAFAGVTVTFADGVSTTTLVPYQGGTAGPRR